MVTGLKEAPAKEHLQLQVPDKPELLEAPEKPELLEAPVKPELLEAPTAPLQIATASAEENDADFPSHMLLWTVLGVIAYFALIAATMIYAAVLSPAAFR